MTKAQIVWGVLLALGVWLVVERNLGLGTPLLVVSSWGFLLSLVMGPSE